MRSQAAMAAPAPEAISPSLSGMVAVVGDQVVACSLEPVKVQAMLAELF